MIRCHNRCAAKSKLLPNAVDVKMTHLIEYAKIRDVILIYHFEFERNDQMSIGDHFSCSINKYMCLNDWLAISQALTDCIGACLSALSTKCSPTSVNIRLPHLSIALNVNWVKLDPIYASLTKIPVTEIVHPFVLKLNVTSLSNTNGFRSINSDQSIEAPAAKENHVKSNDIMERPNALSRFKLKEAIVMIEKVNIDDYMPRQQNESQVVGIQQGNSVRQTNGCIDVEVPSVSGSDPSIGISSTPLPRRLTKLLSKTRKGVSRISAIRRRSANTNVMNPVILTTPDVKSRMTRKARPILLRDKFVLQSTKKKKVRVVQKKTHKRIGRAVVEKTKVLQTPMKRPRIASPANSTGLFEEMPLLKKRKNLKTGPSPPPPRSNPDIFDLKSISENDLKQSFQTNFTQLSKMFEDYQLQENGVVMKAIDYDHIDIISLLQSEHIQIMLDMLYNHFVVAEIHGTTSFTNLFFEQMVPEWSLAIFMEKFSMTRKDAVEKIQHQNQHQNNHVDDSQSLFITQNSLDADD